MNKTLLSMTALVWLALIGGGETILLNFENRPGRQENGPEVWPAEAGLQRNPDRMTLVMFVHPHCPCTKASVGEFEILMARTRGQLNAYVIFLKPGKFSEDWARTDLWRSVLKTPDTQAVIDENGAQSKRFAALTSGQTFLYDRQGRLIFSGGITASRGHSGDNAGRSAIESLVLKREASQRQTAVFGCPLSEHRIKWPEMLSFRGKEKV